MQLAHFSANPAQSSTDPRRLDLTDIRQVHVEYIKHTVHVRESSGSSDDDAQFIMLPSAFVGNNANAVS